MLYKDTRLNIYILTACISFADGLFTLLIPLIHCMVAAVMVVT